MRPKYDEDGLYGVPPRFFHVAHLASIFRKDDGDIPDGATSTVYHDSSALVVSAERIANANCHFDTDDVVILRRDGTLTKVWQYGDTLVVRYTAPGAARDLEAPSGTFVLCRRKDFLKQDFLSKKRRRIAKLDPDTPEKFQFVSLRHNVPTA